MNRFIIALACLAACDSGTTGNTPAESDTSTTPTSCADQGGPFAGNTEVIGIDVGCPTDPAATLAATLTGLSASGSATMFLQETGNTEPQWSEEHPLDTKTFDPCGYSENLEQIIETTGVATTDWIPGQASVFTCAGHFTDPAVLTIAVYVEDVDDASVTSCLVVGDDPAGLIAGNYMNANSAVDPSFPLTGCVAAR